MSRLDGRLVAAIRAEALQWVATDLCERDLVDLVYSEDLDEWIPHPEVPSRPYCWGLLDDAGLLDGLDHDAGMRRVTRDLDAIRERFRAEVESLLRRACRVLEPIAQGEPNDGTGGGGDLYDRLYAEACELAERLRAEAGGE